MRPGFMVSVGMVEGENSRCQVVAGNNNNEIWPAEGCNTKSQPSSCHFSVTKYATDMSMLRS